MFNGKVLAVMTAASCNAATALPINTKAKISNIYDVEEKNFAIGIFTENFITNHAIKTNINTPNRNPANIVTR